MRTLIVIEGFAAMAGHHEPGCNAVPLRPSSPMAGHFREAFIKANASGGNRWRSLQTRLEEECMHTLAQPSLAAEVPPSAAERALRRWFPWCNARVARAIRVARPKYPLIEGGKPERSRVVRAPDGGLVA